MTSRPRYPRPAPRPLLAPLLLAAALAGCEGSTSGGGPNNRLRPVSTRDPQLDALSQSAELLSRVKHVLNAYCAECHSGRENRAEGGFGSVFDAQKMAADDIIALGDPDRSKLIERVLDDSMPPADYGFRPTKQDIELLKLWIREGSPSIIAKAERPRPTREAVLSAMKADLAAQPSESRGDVRYLSLATLVANPNVADRELEAYENAVSKLVNSLSTTPAIVRPAPVLNDEGQTVALRVRLRDYGWGQADWGTIERASQLVDRVQAPCDVAFLNADTFVAIASNDNVAMRDGTSTSVYSNIVLKNWLTARGALAEGQAVHPDGEATALGWGEIESALGINVVQAISANNGSVRRAGMRVSGESFANRVVERYATPNGYYWRSYDFSAYATGPTADIFSTPVGPLGQIYRDGQPVDPAAVRQFAPDGGAGFFGLPNGLQAYIVVDGGGRMVRAAAQNISVDPLNISGQRANGNGVSCLRCHINGVAEVEDQVRDVILANLDGFDDYSVGFVASLYAPADELRAIIDDDSRRFREASRQAHVYGGGSGPLPDAIADLAGLYQSFQSLESVASEFLVDPETLRQAARSLASKPGFQGIQTLLLEGGGLNRNALIAYYPDLRDALGLGDFGNFCIQPGEKPVEPPPTPEEPTPEEPTPPPPPAPTP